MLSKTIEDDHRFKIRKSALSEWMSKTLESDRFQEPRSKTIQNPLIKNSYTPLISQTYQPAKSVDERIQITKLRPKKSKLKTSLPKRLQHLILNQGLSKTIEQSPTRQNRFAEQYNNFVFNYKPYIANSIQPMQQTRQDTHITKSLDYSQKSDQKPKRCGNPRLTRQFTTIITRMKLLLDTYKARESTLLAYIGRLQQELATLKRQ